MGAPCKVMEPWRSTHEDDFGGGVGTTGGGGKFDLKRGSGERGGEHKKDKKKKDHIDEGSHIDGGGEALGSGEHKITGRWKTLPLGRAGGAWW